MSEVILIIDDLEASRQELARMIESLGYRSLTAGSGLEGLKLVREAQPSLVLLDVVMPSFDGFKIAALIKAMPRFVPVMLLTGLHDLESKRRGQSAGADDFLSKPVEPLELQIRIAAMLRIKSLTDALDAANRRLAELAETDALTGVPNRRAFDSMLAREHERAQRYRRPLAVLMIDIDHFKQVNDVHGHAAGDAVLQKVARALAETLRQSDRLGRFGGEEFGVLAPEVAAAGALALAERLRRRVAALEVDGRRVTVSIGAAAWDGSGDCPRETLLAEADRALYRAKDEGRDRSILTTLAGS